MRAPPISSTARARVSTTLTDRGFLLLQGQWEVPSVADLLAGRPVTTRGYSWDYVPAWTLSYELAARPDVAMVRFFRGKGTLVHERLWPAVDALARASRAAVRAGDDGDDHADMLALVERRPGISGDAIKAEIGCAAPAFQRMKTHLDQWLCILGRDRDDADHHTHDQAWFPWATGKIAKARGERPSLERAVEVLLDATFPDGLPLRMPAVKTLFPAARHVR